RLARAAGIGPGCWVGFPMAHDGDIDMATLNLWELADRARGGDSEAADALRHGLEPQMRHIVRRTLRVGRGNSTIARVILEEAGRLTFMGCDSPDIAEEQKIGQVTRGVCAWLVERMVAGRLNTRRLAETLVG